MGIPATENRAHGIAHAASLASIVGQENTRLRAGVVEAMPADLQQIAEILCCAHENGLSVSPVGSGSKSAWGNPVAPDIRLSLERMRSVREHAWADMTCTVEAGCTWAAMQRELGRHGQMVALDPLWPERATVGGIVATNDSGSLRTRYGSLRDLIIGMTLVLADGTVARTGGKVVKNVAGYDLHKLMTGSFGTLGVVAQVNFRLHPAEKHRLTCTAEGRAAAYFTDLLHALLNSELPLSRVQLRATQSGCALDIGIAGRAECLDKYAARALSIIGPGMVMQPDEAVWSARQDLFDQASTWVMKISTLPGEICVIIAELQQWAADRGLCLDCVAQASGLITVALQSNSDRASEFIDFARARLRACGGSALVLQFPEELRGSVDVWGMDSDTLPLMREIKNRFDPRRILNPGRFVGNI